VIVLHLLIDLGEQCIK